MTATPVPLDEADKVILRELQHDGRVSYATLAPAVGLSAPAVRARVQRLIDSGVLQVVGVTDPMALGFPVMAMVEVACRSAEELLAIIDGHIKQVPGVRGAESFVYFGIHTHRFAWGVS